MRSIDADELNGIKFHPLPYAHIVPNDVNAESYERGWNDAVDAIIENAPTIEPERKTGKWIDDGTELGCQCSECGKTLDDYLNGNLESITLREMPNYCPNCGAKMEN